MSKNINKSELNKFYESVGKINERKRAQRKTREYRENKSKKRYLAEIVEADNPKFTMNNLIVAPVGSGKSYLIENTLIPKDIEGKALYLTSNTALKDSVCPSDNVLRETLEQEGKSTGFFTTENTTPIGSSSKRIHVMTYHEFGKRLELPNEVFTKDIEVVFCDEIHSLPIFKSYDNSPELDRAMRWLFMKHEDKQIFYFTATKEKLDELEKSLPGYLSAVTTYDYTGYTDIVRYVANTTYLISHLEQLRPHLRAKLNAFNYYGHKGLAFTKYIEDQNKIYEIAKSEGFKPIELWSVNNNEKPMSDEQLRVREFVLNTGYIPEPYNLLIINGSMQEGWNLEDDMMRLAILDTLDLTEQIQALGRIRRDIDILIKKTDDEGEAGYPIEIPDSYLCRPLDKDDKTSLYMKLNIINKHGSISKWPTIKRLAKTSGYKIEDKQMTIDGKRARVSIITAP